MSNSTTIHYQIPLQGIKVSTNKIYAGIHWGQRQSIKDSIASVAGYFCRPIQKVGSYPVQIHYKFFFGSKPLDTLNTAFMAKCIEDAFRALGILEEDDVEHVAESILTVVALPREKTPKSSVGARAKGNAQDKDRVEITINSFIYG
jgi:hypothetical protein